MVWFSHFDFLTSHAFSKKLKLNSRPLKSAWNRFFFVHHWTKRVWNYVKPIDLLSISKVGVFWTTLVCSDRSVSTVLGDATGGLGTAGREGALTSNEQDVRKSPSRTYLRILRFAMRGWLSVTAILRWNRSSISRSAWTLSGSVDKTFSTAILADVQWRWR